MDARRYIRADRGILRHALPPFRNPLAKTGISRAALLLILQLSAFIPLLAACLLPLTASAAPSWWAARGVIETNAMPSDYSPLVLGQLKWMATNAYLELEGSLPGGAGAEVLTLVRGFQNTNNWLTVNVGQLKAVAQPFYDRLIAQGMASAYPWTSTTNDDRDYALANVGQLKFMFDFAIDADLDGLPDDWERANFGDLAQTGDADADSDGLSNLGEYQAGTNPNRQDSDGDHIADGWDAHPLLNSDADLDGLPDDWELAFFGNLNQTGSGDADLDGRSNSQEYANYTNPTNNDVTAPTITIAYPVNSSLLTVAP